MTQNVPDFSALLRGARRTAVHLEMRDVYGVADEAFTGDGAWAGHEFTEDPAVVRAASTAFEAVWERGTPHDRYSV
ncbi:DUF6879 family protein [Kitasatospora aureofaciens]|uniref:DUF6879 family protein n=1 Tax=Kitasatospora aureofaciens TaxID=1894 RepID=UPI0037C6EAF7